MNKEEIKALRDRLFYSAKPCFDRMSEEDKSAAEAFAKRYIGFLNEGKTERDCCARAIELAREAGFKPIEPNGRFEAGSRVYMENRGKGLMLAAAGRRPVSEGLTIIASHIDSPRIDLKPQPLYEDGGVALLKTHYYGGIKKYQWTSIPLELRGVVIRADGERVDISIGKSPDDPVFTITDLLPHLAKDQMKKSMSDGIEGENLNALAGSLPFGGDEEGKERVKLALLSMLNERYGITETDFLSAELSLVPAFPAREVGFDRSMIGGYGHDDRVCAYASLEALISLDTPEYTAVCILADKEETGSEGVTGMYSTAFERFISLLCRFEGADIYDVFSRSVCISADVLNALDPTYPSVSEKRNSAVLGCGPGVVKYTGARGKSGTSDASAELMGQLRRLLDGASVVWQSGELGAVDQGGGGTVAKILANRNIDCVDMGTPVLSMHAPFEVVSKLDVYETFRGYRAFYSR